MEETTTTVIRQSTRKVTVIDGRNEQNASTKRLQKSTASSKSSKISSEVQSETKNEKALRNRKAVSQSRSEDVNETIQDAYVNGSTLQTSSLLNGDSSNDHSVYKFYKEAGEYWNKFPKTDYTYSRYSPHRKEVAPGVMAIPNMSRRSLHTDFDGDTQSISNQRFYEYERLIRNRKLINSEEELIRRRSYYHGGTDENDFQKETVVHKILRYTGILFIYTSIVKIFTYLFHSNDNYHRYSDAKQNWFLRFSETFTSRVYRLFSLFYTLLCSVMIFDRKLLWSLNRQASSIKRVVLLAALPPLILGVLWLLLKSFTWFDIAHGSLLQYSIPYYESSSSSYSDFLPSLSSINPFPFVSQFSFVAIPSLFSYLFSSSRESPISDFNKLAFNDELIAEIHQIVDLAVAKKMTDINNNNNNKDTINREIVKEIVEETQNNYLAIQNENFKTFESRLHSDLSQDRITAENQMNLINHLRGRVDDIFNDRSKVESLTGQYEELLRKVESLNVKIVDNEYKSNNQISVQLKQCCDTNLEEIKSIVHSQLVHWDSEKGNRLQEAIDLLKDKLNLILTTIDTNKVDIDSLKDDRSEINDLREELLKLREDLTGFISTKAAVVKSESVGVVADEHIEKIVKAALAKYDADKTGRVDFALEPSGGQVLSTRCTESYNVKTAVLSVWGIPLWTTSNSPRVVINRGVVPGECWAFQGFPGFLVIKLSHLIQISGFSLEHIPKQLAPTGHIDSAPKNFTILGLATENDAEPFRLGDFMYDEAGDPVQFFPVAIKDAPVFQIVELRIESNHGNINFTCLYRFRVHGTIVKKYRR